MNTRGILISDRTWRNHSISSIILIEKDRKSIYHTEKPTAKHIFKTSTHSIYHNYFATQSLISTTDSPKVIFQTKLLSIVKHQRNNKQHTHQSR
jgi:hypothetical protein